MDEHVAGAVDSFGGTISVEVPFELARSLDLAAEAALEKLRDWAAEVAKAAQRELPGAQFGR